MEKLTLKWKNHSEALSSHYFELLRADKLTDCSLSADGEIIKTHRVVLAAASPFFEVIFFAE
jgi:BTB/POZ domain